MASRVPLPERPPTLPLFAGLTAESPAGSPGSSPPSRSFLEGRSVSPQVACSPPTSSSPIGQDSVQPPSSPKLSVARDREHIESFNPTATKLRLQIDNLMKRAMAALAAGDLRTFQVTKARVGELQKALAEAELLPAPAPSFSSPDEEARMPPAVAPTGVAVPKGPGETSPPTPSSPAAGSPHQEASSSSHLSPGPLGVEVESVEITILDCVVCYSQEEVQVAYGVCCKRRSAVTKVYHRYHEFRALYDRLAGNSLAHALATYLPALSPFPGPKIFGSTNRSRRSIDQRRAALEAYLRSLAGGTPAERTALGQFLFPVQPEPVFSMKSLWRFSSDARASGLRLCIWPFEVRMYAGEEVLLVAEATPISRAEAALRYRVLLNFQQWAVETFPNDTLPTERNYQMFLHSPRALALPAADDGNPTRAQRRLARATPSTNSHHRVAFAEDMCKHTVVRVVRNARRYVPPPAGSFGPACIQCNPRRRSLPEALPSPLGGVADLGSGPASC
eukprot:EG_transcript_9467